MMSRWASLLLLGAAAGAGATAAKEDDATFNANEAKRAGATNADDFTSLSLNLSPLLTARRAHDAGGDLRAKGGDGDGAG